MATFTGGPSNDILPSLLFGLLQGAGDDVMHGHAGDDLLVGWGGDDVLIGGAHSDTLIGGILTIVGNVGTLSLSGDDTADYASSAAGVMIDLQQTRSLVVSVEGLQIGLAGASQGLGGDAEGDILAGISNLLGSAFNDVLSVVNGRIAAGGGDDFLIGGAGANVLDGGAGADTVSYANSTAGVTVDLARVGAQPSPAFAAGDVLTGIENLVGSAFNDDLTGDAQSNMLQGGAGDDRLSGGGGFDYLDGGLGADAMDGGDGFDTASWLWAANGAAINLTAQAANAGAAAGDALANIENYYLTNFADTFTNDARGGYVYGFNGSDVITGGAGSDVIDGGAAADTLNGGAGFDYASWNSSTTGVVVNLNNQVQNAGGAAGDVVSNFEAYFLSEQADIFTGANNGASIVFGFGGDDVLSGGAQSNEWLFGGDGADTLNGGALNDLLSGGAGADRYVRMTVNDGFDSILDFASGEDKFVFSAGAFGFSAGATLGAGQFIAAASPFATAAGSAFLYSTSLGILDFDADGSGAASSAIALAQIAGAPNVLAADCVFV